MTNLGKRLTESGELAYQKPTLMMTNRLHPVNIAMSLRSTEYERMFCLVMELRDSRDAREFSHSSSPISPHATLRAIHTFVQVLLRSAVTVCRAQHLTHRTFLCSP